MSWPWPPLRRNDIAALLLAIALLGAVLLAAIGLPGARPLENWGFGAEWRCSGVATSEPVCVKESPAAQK